MDFLNKSLAQLKDLFSSMTPGARITAGLLLAVVVISLGYLFTHEIAGPQVFLLGGEMFPSSELSNMAAAFSQEGLDSYEIEGNKIRIPRGQRDEYMAALAKHNALPEEFDDILTRALDTGSPFTSPTDREARLKIARQKYLSRMLGAWPGIERAYVIYDTKKRRGLAQDTVTTASVQIKPRGAGPLDPAMVSSIRMTVGKAIQGLGPEDCAVTDMSTGRTTVGNSESYGGQHDDVYAARKHDYEQDYRNKILKALDWISGVTVTTDAVLDTEKKHLEENVERTVDSNAPAGSPGFLAEGNTARSLDGPAARTPKRVETQTDGSRQNLVSSTRITSETAGFALKQVNVAVTVPTGYFEQVWRRGNPPQEGDQPKKPEQSDLEPIRTRTIARVKEVVATIIPKPADASDAKELVTVAEFPDIAPPEIPQPGIGENVLAWLGNYWSTVGLIGLAFFSLIMLRSMIRAAPAPQVDVRTSAAVPGETGEQEEEPAKEAAGRKLKRFAGSGGSLRDELSDLVNEDPDTAANILRNWIGTAT